MRSTPMRCKSCDAGDTPKVIDRDGVLSSVSDNPGCWGHSYEDDWWPCQLKAAEEHAVVERFNRMLDCIVAADGSGSPEEFCARVVEILLDNA